MLSLSSIPEKKAAPHQYRTEQADDSKRFKINGLLLGNEKAH
jgi:hypothetical protein